MRRMQAIILWSLIVLFWAYLSRFRSILIDRLICLMLFCAAVLAVLFPDYTTAIANVVGIGRGTDLIFYLFALSCLFVFIVLYSKIIEIAQIQTEIIRAIAVKNAKYFVKEGNDDSTDNH